MWLETDGIHGSSIFPAPCRQSLAEQKYRAASDRNQAVTGRRLFKQTCHLMPKTDPLGLPMQIVYADPDNAGSMAWMLLFPNSAG